MTSLFIREAQVRRALIPRDFHQLCIKNEEQSEAGQAQRFKLQ